MRAGIIFTYLVETQSQVAALGLLADNPPTFWQILLLAGGLALSLAGVIATAVFALSTLSRTAYLLSALFRRSVSRSHVTDLLKAVIGFTVCGGLIYYFWDTAKLFLRFGGLLVQAVAAFGACLFPIFAIAIFLLLIFLLKQGSRVWLRYVRAGRKILNKPIVITLALPLLLVLLPKSDATILRSWAPYIDPAPTQRGLTFFGKNQNTYVLDRLGRATEVNLRNGSVSNLKDLPNLENLSSLETLDVQGVPLQGVQDVSQLKSLRVLRLSRTHLEGLIGLSALPKLEELHVDNVDIAKLGDLNNLSSLKKLSLIDCKIENLSAIGELNNLESLELDGANLHDLSPLSNLNKLTLLSIAGTNVADLSPVRKLPIVFLNVTDTSIKREDLTTTFTHPVLVVNRRVGIDDGLLTVTERFIPSPIKVLRNRILIGICALTIGLLIWQLYPRKSRLFLMCWLIYRKTIFGVLLVLLLITLAHIQLPIYIVSNVGIPDVSGLLMRWATIIAICWLGLRPLLILGLETLWLNSSAWSVVASAFARFMPAVAVVGPISYSSLKASFPSGPSFVNVIGFGLYALIFGVPWLVAGFFLLMGVQNWRNRLRTLNSQGLAGAIIEIPFGPLSTILNNGGTKSVSLSLTENGGRPSVLTSRLVITTTTTAALSRVSPMRSYDAVGSVITLKQADLLRLRKWEIRLVSDWIRSLYERTWYPIWIVSDWVEKPRSGSYSVRKLRAIDGLFPYLSGMEHRFKIGSTIFPLESKETIQQCLTANELVSAEILRGMAIDLVLRDAYTPAAVLCRSIFGQPQIADRLDVLTRATEVAVAFFALVLTAEYDSQREALPLKDRNKIEGALTWTFSSPPEFGAWVTLLLTFTRRAGSELSSHLKNSLQEAPPPAANELRVLLEQATGASLPLGQSVKTRSQSLILLQHVRNLLTAHGPVIERASAELYTKTLLITIDLLAALPWAGAVACQFNDESTLTYQGVRVQEVRPEISHSANGMFIRTAGSGGLDFVDARKYFRSVNGSVAMNIGETGFFDPLTGLRV